MKKTILGIFILLSAISFSEDGGRVKESKYKFSLGAMVGHGSKLYKIEKDKVNYIPFISLESEDLYIRGTEFGYKHRLNSRLVLTGFSQLFGGIQLQGVGGAIGAVQLDNSDMEDGYKGIDDRDTQVEVGLKLDYDTKFKDVKLQGELRGGERGGAGKISAMRTFKITNKLFVVPQVSFSLLDENLIDYYFGISEDEVNDSRNNKINKAYDINKFAYASAIGGSVSYNFNPEWSIFGLTELQYVSNEIGDSPIVDNRVNYFMSLGIRYNF